MRKTLLPVVIASLIVLAGLLACAPSVVPSLFAEQPVPELPDSYIWLEDIHSPRAMDWVKAENERTAKALESDPHFAPLQADALKILESPDRLPEPEFRGEFIYNTWQDAGHVRGIVRRTTLADYSNPTPHWQTVLDYDALAKQDKESWVQKGLNCLYPGDDLCLVSLSAGGEDADTIREFSLKTGKFVENGFNLPRAKQTVTWVDKDTLAVSRDYGPGTMSQAGYAIVTRLWKRGEPLEQAKELFRGAVSDGGYGDYAYTLHDAQAHHATLITRNVTTFEREQYLVTPSANRKLAIPPKSNFDGLLNGQLLLSIDEAWQPEGSTVKYPQGSELSLDLAAVARDPEHLKPTVVFTPTAEEFAQSAGTTRNYLVLSTLDHVQGRAYVYSYANGAWTHARIPIPDNETVSLTSFSDSTDNFFISLDGFLTPPSVWLGDAARIAAGDGKIVQTRSERPLFDASKDVVDQRDATSKDGTHVPYFVVHRKDISYDGTSPTLMTAYGGFEVSNTPYYSGVMGKLWLERGGVFVLANIRGGGEFGPAWHEAGLKTHRQRIYDDFYSVAQDLVTRKITSSQRLGILGGSNGGLLMGVEFTQHPEMWNAVIINVPLLDMLGFEHMSAGASWVGEYGSVSVPEERTFLASISPYNQLKPTVAYPEPLIFTTTKDDRVGPVHARKFAARLEEYHKPFYYDEIVEGGHGLGADNKEAATTYAVDYTYLTRKLME